MQKIINELKLDFDDVLIVPQRSTLTSRSEINLERTFQFYHSNRTWTGIPIICANMSFCSFDMAKELADHKMIACLHKYHSIDSLVEYFNQFPKNIDYTFISIGYKKSDLQHLLEFKNKTGKQPNICIDVPNGHMDVFVKYCKKVRENFPESIIIAGNVTNTASTQELLIYGGVDIVKVGIGGGCFVAGTTVLTNDGYKNIERIKVGDNVITHRGKLNKVVATNSRIETDTIIDINGIKCTPNHQFYVVLKEYTDIINENNLHQYAKWVSAGDLSEDYCLVKYQEMKFILEPITKIDSYETTKETVYDIEVENDHSFCVQGGIVVHNSACTTRFLTGCGVPQLSSCLENSYIAHGLQNGSKKSGLICSDGGHKTVGDICKALCAGADFVMLGGYFAGSEPCEGEWEYEYRRAIISNKGEVLQEWWQPLNPGDKEAIKRKKLFTYYGMSTHHAQDIFEEGKKDYRASEGTKITVQYKGTLTKIVQELLGGIRSCCCYIGSRSIKHMSRCGQFCRVSQIHSNKNPVFGV
jgi:IMP dehydrogenase/GMP reductase